MPRKISSLLREQVRQRAAFLCEYCHTDEHWQLVPFTVDHIRPTAEGGDDILENLALACFHCNRHKSDQQSVFDAMTQTEIPLFNPRQMLWAEHFCWSGDGLRILPQSDIGRVTIAFLNLNRERVLRLRQDDIAVNRHPPSADTAATHRESPPGARCKRPAPSPGSADRRRPACPYRAARRRRSAS